MNTKENRDDTLEKLAESWDIEGMKTQNYDKSKLDARLMDAIRKIQKEQLDNNFRIKVVSPLSPEIIAEAFSPKFKLLSLHKYNGK